MELFSEGDNMMNEDRRKEIALMVVEQIAVERGIPATDKLKRDLGNLAGKIGVQTEELMEFYQSITPKILGRIFGYQKVSINMSEKR